MRQRIGRISWAIYVFLWAWSVPLLSLDIVPVGGEFMASVMLILPGSLCGWWLIEQHSWSGAWASGAILVGSWLTEHVGVTTGVPFGSYQYNGVLLPEIIHVVPLAIPFAWLLVVPASMEIARIFIGRVSGMILVVVSATWAVLFDIVIEPAAVYIYRYWTWLESGGLFGIPTSNFLAWWGLAFVLVTITLILTSHHDRLERSNVSLPALIYCMNMGLFSLVNLTHEQYGAAMLGIALLALVAFALQRRGIRWQLRYDGLMHLA